MDKTRSYKPEETYVRQGEFDSLTSYNKEFTRMRKRENQGLVNIDLDIFLAKDGERAKPIRHDAQRGVQAPFEGDPTYRSKILTFD